jgi:hypothetical protein
MTPKEKAEELLESVMFSLSKQIDLNTGEYKPILTNPYYKECALIVVDEILNEVNDFIQTDAHLLYWEEVKQEIETFNTEEK